MNLSNEERTFHRGEVYWANLGYGFGSEQGGTRPVVVLQNNIGNIYCPTLIVAPMTTHIWKKAQSADPFSYQWRWKKHSPVHGAAGADHND